MHILLLSSILSTLLLAQNITDKQVQRLKGKNEISYDDLAHENFGCPENSKCSEDLGKKMQAFNYLFQDKKNLNKNLNKFRKKVGIPLTFYTSVQADDMITYISRCRQHNPKEGKRTVEATMFLKRFESHENMYYKKLELLELKKSYLISINDTPLYIEDGKLVVLKESEDSFYYLNLRSDGYFSIIEPSTMKIKKANNYLDLVKKCPRLEQESTTFASQICRNIYNFDSKKTVVARIDWDCP